jgi:hypothetical protein
MLPRKTDEIENDDALDPEEEARVFYVGSTRVKREFLRGTAQTMVGAGRLDSSGKRVAEILGLNKKPKFQFGLNGDLDDAAPVSRVTELCGSKSAAIAHQSLLVDTWASTLKVNECPQISGESKQVTVAGKMEYRYRFTLDGALVAWSDDGLNKDLWTACNVMRRKVTQQKGKCGELRPPDEIPNLRLIGLRTCAVADDPVMLGNLSEPFASSGFWLAPMIVGFPSIFLVFQANRTSYRRNNKR